MLQRQALSSLFKHHLNLLVDLQFTAQSENCLALHVSLYRHSDWFLVCTVVHGVSEAAASISWRHWD